MITNLNQSDKIFEKFDAEKWIQKYNVENDLLDNQNLFTQFKKHELSGQSFEGFLKDVLVKVNQFQVEANDAMKDLSAGKSKNLHETMMLMEKADMAFRTMNQIRSKVLEAYKEIMKIQM